MADPRGRIVILDDEADFRTMVGEYLSHHGYAVHLVESGSALDSWLAGEAADLIILDLNLPEENGLSIARRLKASGTTPIIMLTGAGEPVDRIVGLEVGADDYIVKPCDLRELLARTEAVLRRTRRKPAPLTAPSPGESRFISFGNVALDPDDRRLITLDGRAEHLTASEHILLLAFARHPRRVLSRDHLLGLGSNGGNDPYDRSIDSRIKRIRKKIEIDPAKPQVIKTIRNRGYVFVPPEGP